MDTHTSDDQTSEEMSRGEALSQVVEGARFQGNAPGRRLVHILHASPATQTDALP